MLHLLKVCFIHHSFIFSKYFILLGVEVDLKPIPGTLGGRHFHTFIHNREISRCQFTRGSQRT